MSSSHHTSQSATITVVLVDDSELVRRGIKEVLATSENPRIRVVAEADSCSSALKVLEKNNPDIILLDIRLPDGSGLDLCRRFAQLGTYPRVVMLTSYSSDTYVYEAITAGAQGYLMKEIDPAGLIQAVVDVHQGKSILDPEATARVMQMVRTHSGSSATDDLGSLSPQELRVLALVASGKTNKEIGEKLGLSDNTVKNLPRERF